FGCGHELLDPLHPKRVAEVGVAEFALKTALLLLFDPSTRLQRYPNNPFKIIIGDRHVGIRKEQLHQAAYSLVDGLDVTSTESATPEDAILKDRNTAGLAQARPALAEEVTDQSEMVGQVLVRVELREVPARCKGMDAVVEGRIVPHFLGQGTQEVADPLLLLHVHIKVAEHHYRTFGSNALLPTAELS